MEEKKNTFGLTINQTEVNEKEILKISSVLANNIKMIREDEHFLDVEKASIADALYGISIAKADFDKDDYTLDKLNAAENAITSYLFYLDIMKAEE